MDEWDKFLEANCQQITEFGDISPALLLIKGNTQPTVCLLEDFKDGNSIADAIGKIIKQTNPDSYIFSSLGWSTDFGDKVYGDSPKYEHIVDMPPDDKSEVYVQIEIIKPGRISRCYTATVNRYNEEIFTNVNKDILESKFVCEW